MKMDIVRFLRVGIVGLMAAGFTCSLQAVPITGSINFNGSATLDGDASSATGFNQITVSISGSSETGTYAGVVATGPVVFTTFEFNQNSVIPLWEFPVGNLDYGFDANTVNIERLNLTSNPVIHLYGTGSAYIRGSGSNYDQTEGTWEITLTGNTGQATFGFGAKSTVPDGGTTVLMLGAGFLCLGLLRRKLA